MRFDRSAKQWDEREERWKPEVLADCVRLFIQLDYSNRVPSTSLSSITDGSLWHIHNFSLHMGNPPELSVPIA